MRTMPKLINLLEKASILTLSNNKLNLSADCEALGFKSKLVYPNKIYFSSLSKEDIVEIQNVKKNLINNNKIKKVIIDGREHFAGEEAKFICLTDKKHISRYAEVI